MSLADVGSEPLAILVADRAPLVREGLMAIIGREPDMIVTGEAESAEEARALHAALAPAVTLVGRDLLDNPTCVFTEAEVEAELLIFAGDAEVAVPNAAVTLPKSSDGLSIVRAVRRVASGQDAEGPVDPDPPAHGGGPVRLTGRQSSIVRLLVQGWGTGRIARALGLSPHTVKTYVREIYRALGVGTRAQAVAMAIRLDLQGNTTSIKRT